MVPFAATRFSVQSEVRDCGVAVGVLVARGAADAGRTPAMTVGR